MKRITLLSTLLVLPFLALAGVNPKNGNFYVTYTDISVSRDGHDLELSRTYNSKATELGWFGVGWGSTYETHLTVLPDGSAAIKENGTGRITYYRTSNAAAIKAGVQRLVNATSQKETLTQEASDALAAKLLSDEDLRLSKAIQYGLESTLQSDGTLEDECGKATLSRVPEGYLRLDCNRFGSAEPAKDTFDMQGRMIRHELKNGYAVVINHAKTGTTEIRDTLGQSIALTWTPDGRVAGVASGDQSTAYTYEDNNLVVSSDTGGNTYRYSYDTRHNLTRVQYLDNSSMFISYSPKVNGTADSVTHRNGEQQTFVYRTDPNDSNHYWTTQTDISPSGETSSREYEFHNQTGPTGITQPSKIVLAGDGGTTETQCDQKGRMVRKIDKDGEFVDYVYHPQNGKLILVLKKDLRTEFHYDAKGNLVQAANSAGKVIDLTYADSDSIQSMVVNAHDGAPRRELKFQYNTKGKPTHITLVGVGQIDVEYDDAGEITKVNSQKGMVMALQVTQIFQNLLSVVSVAGAKL